MTMLTDVYTFSLNLWRATLEQVASPALLYGLRPSRAEGTAVSVVQSSGS